MTKATRRIKKFDFENEGAHVALVDRAANAQSVLVMKSLTASEEEIQKALDKDVTVRMTIMEFLTRYLGIWHDDAEIIAGLLGYTAEDLYTFEDSAMSFTEYLQGQMDSVEIQKSEKSQELAEKLETFKSKYLDQDSPSSVEKDDGESDSPTDDNQEVTTEMTEENKSTENELTLEEQIQKAAERLMETHMEEVRKREEQRDRELEILKAEQAAQRHAKFVAKAENMTPHLGEEAEVEPLAKALEKASTDEELSPLVKALEALVDTADKSEYLEEVGKSASGEQPVGKDQEVIAKKEKLMADEGLDENTAYLRAFESVHG